jgi:hypothetical protein
MSNENELLPCKKCNSEPQLSTLTNLKYYVICRTCNSRPNSEQYIFRADAIESWNSFTKETVPVVPNPDDMVSVPRYLVDNAIHYMEGSKSGTVLQWREKLIDIMEANQN